MLHLIGCTLVFGNKLSQTMFVMTISVEV